MNEALMTIGEFAEMLGSDIQIKGAPGIKFSSVSFDSRSVRPNGLFFAIEGERDGHEFVQAASDAGAAAAVVTHFVPVSLPQVLVKDTREALLGASTEALQARKDPLLAFGIAWNRDLRALRERERDWNARAALYRPVWRRAVAAHAGKPVAVEPHPAGVGIGADRAGVVGHGMATLLPCLSALWRGAKTRR